MERQDLVPYLDHAQDEGTLSDETRRILEERGIQNQYLLTAGTPVSQIEGDELTLLTMLLDDSYSMDGMQEAVIKGHNRILDVVIQKARNPKAVLVSTHTLNGGLVSAYTPIESAIRLSRENYEVQGGTPLYTRAVEVIGAVPLKAQEGRDDWKTVRTASLIMTDGGDTSTEPVERIHSVISDLVASKRHLIAAMGFGSEYTFKPVFTGMGIDPLWQLTANASDEEILKALGLFAEIAATATDEDAFPLLITSGIDSIRHLPGN